ncbi:MAG: hypothetical protein EA416_03295 [Trueperaceae bacterium]|nr:MAG: hypothetical protein EA416_03295 [Trueperaceae bacterium]
MTRVRRSWTCWSTRALVLAVVAWALTPALGQDDLYGPSVPPEAAWVRAVNAEAPGGLGIRIGDGPLESIAFAHATAYRVVAPGDVAVDLGGVVTPVPVEAGAFLTVVATSDAVHVIDDSVLVDVSRGLLALYNLTELGALDLVVRDGPPVVEGVPPWDQAAVAVAEAEVELEVRFDEEVIGTLESRVYERAVAHSVIVVEGPDGPLVRYVAAAVAE